MTLFVDVEQRGEFVAITYHADDSAGTATPAEKASVDRLVELIQKHIVDEGGIGTFVAKQT